MKRIAAWVIVLVMVLTLVPFEASAANSYPNTHVNTGNQVKDIIEVAKTQLGNTDGSKYGAGDAPWCAYFISWCARQAGISKDIIKTTGWAAADDLGVTYKGRNASRSTGINYTPKAGDIIIFDWEYNGFDTRSPASFYGDHVGIVTSVSNGKVYTIEGNAGSGFAVITRSFSLKDNNIKGYGIPDYKMSSTPPSQPTYDTDYKKYTTPNTTSDYGWYDAEYGVMDKPSGTTTSEIMWMQATLNYCIKNLGLKASYLEIDGYFGPACKAATLAFQTKYRLDADGGFGPETTAKMKAVLSADSSGQSSTYQNTHTNTGNQRVDIVEVAKTQVGCADGTKYASPYGASSASWGAYFIVWCARQAGISDSTIKTTGWAAADDFGVTYKGRSADRSTGLNYTPQAGDIIIFDWESDGFDTRSPASFYGDQVGIVTDVTNGMVYTIVGNTGSHHSVVAKSFSLTSSDIKGYGVPNYSGSSSENASLSLNQNSAIINAGDTVDIGFIFTGSVSEAVYDIADQAVCSYMSSECSLTSKTGSFTFQGLKNGSTDITISLKDAAGKALASGTCRVTVNEKMCVAVAEVSLNKTAFTLKVGETETLTAAVLPSDATNKVLSWSSSNTDVATVSQTGIVTAKAVGSATITAAAVDGGKVASCMISVIPVATVEGDAIFTFSKASGMPGDTVKVTLHLTAQSALNSIGLTNISYDSSILEFIGFEGSPYLTGKTLFDPFFDSVSMSVTIALSEAIPFDGDICMLKFKIRDAAEESEMPVTAVSIVKCTSTMIPSEVRAGSISIVEEMLGDINGDLSVDIADAELLFRYSILPSIYPISYHGSADFNKDGSVDIADAELLFRYSILPGIYPIER